MKKDLLKQIIRDFHLCPLPTLYKRELEPPSGTGKIITLIGARRSGKTSFLFNIIEKLLKQGTNKTAIVYINFEDERLDLNTAELDLIIKAYLELYPNTDLNDCCFLFDEIQNIEKWDKFIRRLYDNVSRNIFITGSNARLLSSEIATSLRGRTVSYEVFPLSFREYLSFKGLKADLHSSKSVAQINHNLSLYLKDGGFPETVRYDADFRRRVLQEYFNVLIYRDLLERYEIKNLAALKFFLKRVLASATKQLSVNTIYNELKSSGFKIGKNQLYDWLDACQNIYLAFVLKKHIHSLTERELGEKKVYAIDNGLLNALNYRFSDDAGKALEQAVFLELRRRGKEIYFFKDKVECDFIVKEGTTVMEVIQVCLSLTDAKTRKREMRGLLECCKAFGLKKGTIITGDTAEETKEDGISVNIVPLYRWLVK
ncbi:MAG: ATP-binding protein [Deltaproteobacteria bacterium]|nr:ATP-binding protein [Deltaproteobacteria bacterium]